MFCICVVLEISSLLSKNVSSMSSDNKFQPLMVARKKCLNLSVVQMGSLTDFELLIRVFLVLKCRCESAGIATRPFITL